jgi:hypothetical protein
MKNILIVLALLLGGCAFAPAKTDLIVKDHYVIPALPDEATEIPTQVPALPTNPTQKDVAGWLVDNETRSAIMENKLKSLKALTTDIVSKLKLKDGEYTIVDLTKKIEEKK